jgi:tRNA(Ile)-lysidine synthase
VIKHLLSTECFSRLKECNQLIVGFSGGLDSTALLHVLASYSQLSPKLIAVHINHGLSPKASLWQTHCEQFCQSLGIEFISHCVQFDRQANIEEGARIARYEVFSQMLTDKDALILGHHLDDQAETVLLQLVRGAGIDGLAAMTECASFGLGILIRPFLSHSREQLHHYAMLHQLSFVEDESNQDIRYARNYVRQEIIPLLKNKWPGVAGNLARTALHCQQAKRNLDDLALQDLPFLSHQSLCIDSLSSFSFARIANILRVWLKKNQVQIPSTQTFHSVIHEVLFARGDANPEVSWGTVCVRRYQNHLYLNHKSNKKLPKYLEWSHFPLPLEYSGMKIMAKKSPAGLIIPAGVRISLRFREGGEVFIWHGQTKHLKKLFQEWGIPPWLRESIPLIYFDETLAVVVGYAVSDLYFKTDSLCAWAIYYLNTRED